MLTLETRLADITGGYIGRMKRCKCKGPVWKSMPRNGTVFRLGWAEFLFVNVLLGTVCSWKRLHVQNHLLVQPTYWTCSENQRNKNGWCMANLRQLCIYHLRSFGCSHWFTIASSLIEFLEIQFTQKVVVSQNSHMSKEKGPLVV